MKVMYDYFEELRDRKGHSSIVWLCNIGAERYWHRLPPAPADRNEECVVNRVEEIGLLLCRKQDVMILRQQPQSFFLELLEEYGFEIPTIVCPSHPDELTPISELLLADSDFTEKISELKKRLPNPVLLPYGVTKLEEQLAAAWGIPLAASAAGINAFVNDKIKIRKLAGRAGFKLPAGEICHSPAAIVDCFDKLTGSRPGFAQVIIKEPHNASGKGLYVISNREELAKVTRRLERFSRKLEKPAWIVEGWYQKKADLNCQVYVSPRGDTTPFSIKQQLLNGVVYTGSRCPPLLAAEQLEACYGFSRETGRLLYETGYYGIAGIDSIITVEDEFFPLIEINGRFTLSTYLSFIQRVLGPELLYIARYYRVIMAAAMDYEMLYHLLVQAGIQYNPAEHKGILIFNAAALPLHPQEGSSSFIGRVFALSLGMEWQQVEEGCRKLEELLQAHSLYLQ